MTHNCRICLLQIEDTPDKLINIFSLFDASNTIAFNIEKFAEIEIHINDDLPKTVCCECLNKLQECIEFRMKIQNANEMLISPKMTQIKPEDIITSEIEEENDIITTNEIKNELTIDVSKEGPRLRQRKTVPTSTKKSLKKHSNREKKEKPFCPDCDAKIFKNPSLNSHYKDFHFKVDSVKYQNIYFKDNVPYCPKCELHFDAMILLKEHNSLEHDTKEVEMHSEPYKNNEVPYCERCRKMYPSNYSFRKHIVAVHREKLVYGKFIKLDELPKMNAAKCNDEDDLLKFKCQLCNLKFRLERFLAEHRVKDHPEFVPKKENRCETCNEVFGTRTILAEHRIVHSEGEHVRPFVCEKCGKSFLYSYKLNRHIKRSHDTDSLVQCTTCSVKYRKDSKRAHCCKKGYLCSECGKHFMDSSVLRNHMRVHTGEKPYECSFCQKKFRQGSTLRNHMRVHTGERPFVCKECGHDFAYIQETKNHIVRYHMGKGDTQNEDWKTFMQKKVDRVKVAICKEN